MFAQLRRTFGRLFHTNNDDPQAAETQEQQPSPSTDDTQPEQQTRRPDYTSLNQAVEAAQNSKFDNAHQLLGQARGALRPFPHTRSLWLAAAALVNTHDSNFGSAGRLIDQAIAAFEQDYKKLNSDERRFVETARDLTLRKVPIRKLRNGETVMNDHQKAIDLCNAGEYGQALWVLKRMGRAIHASTCLRTHPNRLWEATLSWTDEIYAALERQPAGARMDHLYYGETGNPLTKMEAVVAA